jgi:hypothetical protein
MLHIPKKNYFCHNNLRSQKLVKQNMKKHVFFTLMLMALSVVVMAQNKRIAILEPIDKENSIPYSITVMLRSNLTKMISNIPGYEGYDHVNISKIMDEHDFEGLDFGDEDQIRHLGKMVEADYLLVSEVVKYDETSIFVTAKILNIETAKTEGSENALMGMTAQDIQHGCESLAKKLLYVSNYLNKMIQNSNNDIGEVLDFPDSTKGVVFYLNEKGQGLAVSLNESEEAWDISFRIKDVDSLYNVERGESYFNYNEGQKNTQAILSLLGNKAQAAYWCGLQGEGWYLPSCGELYVLMSVADENAAFINALRSAGGGEIDGWYWSSTERNKEEAWNVKCGGRSSSEEKEEKVKVRAIRAFTIN